VQRARLATVVFIREVPTAAVVNTLVVGIEEEVLFADADH
jgi:hypothetical protein